ncbi:ribonuclease H-like domain-containing protein [Tanacetum coccineum]|uniref:Ribonuclease H-like domain-containing protein n=1 Tax=Tanacetum coccineum TaxID=301880 RepID=A0ABQ5IPM9_9ASTR
MSVSNLTQLAVLDLGSNYFSGPIPPLGSLTKLTHLTLQFNSFDRSNMYDWIGRFPNLLYLDLRCNSLNYEIPSSIGNQTKLEEIYLYDNVPNMFSIRIYHGRKFRRYLGKMYVSGHVKIFDMVDINLFTVVALNLMVVQLGYTSESEPLFYNYLRPLSSLDKGLYALACEEDVRCLAILVRSFKLIEVYIEHGVTALDSYIRPPRELIEEPICESFTPRSLPEHDSSTPRCLPHCMLTPPFDESVITYTQFNGVQGVDTQEDVLPTIQSHFSDINLSFVSQQANASQVIDDVIRQLSFEETKLDGEAGFADVAGSGVESYGLSHDESIGVDDFDLNVNEPVDQNVLQIETQYELPVSEEPNVVRSQEPIVAEVRTQELVVEEVRTQDPIVEDLIVEDYVTSKEDTEQGNGQENESALSDGKFFYDDEGIDTAYKTEYDVQSSEDAGSDDDDEDFLVDEENKIVELDVDAHLFGISIDVPFDNIGVTNLVPDDILEGDDVDVINVDGFDSDPGNDDETSDYRRRRLAELSKEMKSVINASGQWKIRARCDEKVPVLTMSQDIGPTGPNRGMKAGPSGSSGPSTRSKKKEFRVNLDIPVKAVQDQLQRDLEVQISMSKAFRAKSKAEREIREDHILQYFMLKDYVVELHATNPNTTDSSCRRHVAAYDWPAATDMAAIWHPRGSHMADDVAME